MRPFRLSCVPVNRSGIITPRFFIFLVFKIISPGDLANEGSSEIDILELIKELIGESEKNMRKSTKPTLLILCVAEKQE